MNVIHPSFKHGSNFQIGEFNHIFEDCEVGDYVKIRSYVELRPKTIIGNGCYLDSGVKSSGYNLIGNKVTLRYGAIIAREVTIEDDVFVSPNVMTIYLSHLRDKLGGTVIGKGAFIGTNAILGASVKIGQGAVIGILSVVEHCVIEDRCMVRANVTIGSRGQSVKRQDDGSLKRVKTRGGVLLRKGCDIGAGAVINRGNEGDTVIGEGASIGPFCDIGHDVKIGKHCIIGAGTVISGYAEIGDYSRVSPGSTTKNRIKIGQNATVAIGSLVMKDVDDHQTVVGRPAVDIEEFRRIREQLKNSQPL